MNNLAMRMNTTVNFESLYSSMEDFCEKEGVRLVYNVRDERSYLVRSIHSSGPIGSYYVLIDDEPFTVMISDRSKTIHISFGTNPHCALSLVKDGRWCGDAPIEDLGFSIDEFRNKKGELPPYARKYTTP